jgi:hypothetical protein
MKLEYCTTQDIGHIGRNVLLLSAIMESQLKIFFDGQLNFRCKNIALFLPYSKVVTFKFVTLLICFEKMIMTFSSALLFLEHIRTRLRGLEEIELVAEWK